MITTLGHIIFFQNSRPGWRRYDGNLFDLIANQQQAQVFSVQGSRRANALWESKDTSSKRLVTPCDAYTKNLYNTNIGYRRYYCKVQAVTLALACPEVLLNRVR